MYAHHSKNGTTTADKPKRDVGDILLEVGDWKLRKARFPSGTGVDSYPVHFCGKSPEGYGVHRGAEPGDQHRSEENIARRSGRCVKCAERAPDEIMGLWTLHNWEVATR